MWSLKILKWPSYNFKVTTYNFKKIKKDWLHGASHNETVSYKTVGDNVIFIEQRQYICVCELWVVTLPLPIASLGFSISNRLN